MDTSVIEIISDCTMNNLMIDKVKRKCISLKISFVDKAQLLAHNYIDPPELMLRTPIVYRRRIIHWIDADHLYGDQITHLINMKSRLKWIVGHFGSGLFIYWNGFSPKIQNSNKGDGIFLVQEFLPGPTEITILPVLKFRRNPRPDRYGIHEHFTPLHFFATKTINADRDSAPPFHGSVFSYLANRGKYNAAVDKTNKKNGPDPDKSGLEDDYTPTDVTLESVLTPSDTEDLELSDIDSDKAELQQKASIKGRPKRH